jgi:hypothetical protein
MALLLGCPSWLQVAAGGLLSEGVFVSDGGDAYFGAANNDHMRDSSLLAVVCGRSCCCSR